MIISESMAKAIIKNGMLTINLPKLVKTKRKTLKIEEEQQRVDIAAVAELADAIGLEPIRDFPCGSSNLPRGTSLIKLKTPF